MADIDVVRDKSDEHPNRPVAGAGTPGRIAGHRRSPWGWLVPLLLLAVVAVWWMSRRDTPGVTRDVVGTTGSQSDIVRELRMVSGSAAGRRAELDNVSVTSVPGDRTFWVTDEAGGRALVMIQERGGEQQTEIRAGQRLTVHGTIQRAEDATVQDPADRQALQEARTVIRADRVSASNR